MTLTNYHPRTFQFALILFILLALPFQTTVFGKKRPEGKSRHAVARADKGKKLSAKERRAARKNDRLSARDSRRGGRSRLSKRELRRDRNQTAREQYASLKALERRLRRPLSKRERTA